MGRYELQRKIEVATPTELNKWSGTTPEWKILSTNDDTENLSTNDNALNNDIRDILNNMYDFANCKISYRIYDTDNGEQVLAIAPVYFLVNGNNSSNANLPLKSEDNSSSWDVQLSGGNNDAFTLHFSISPNTGLGGTVTYTDEYMSDTVTTNEYSILSTMADTIYNKIYLYTGTISITINGTIDNTRSFKLNNSLNCITNNSGTYSSHAIDKLQSNTFYQKNVNTSNFADKVINFNNKVNWDMILSDLTTNTWHSTNQNENYSIPYKIFFINSTTDIPSGLTPESDTFFTLVESKTIDVMYTNPELVLTGLNTQIYKDTNITISIDTDGTNNSNNNA